MNNNKVIFVEFNFYKDGINFIRTPHHWWRGKPSQASSPKKSTLQALSEPHVNLSTHPALIVQPFFHRKRQ